MLMIKSGVLCIVAIASIVLPSRSPLPARFIYNIMYINATGVPSFLPSSFRVYSVKGMSGCFRYR
ncbi:hypothetical protein D3C75_1228320 [compost metagenome]